LIRCQVVEAWIEQPRTESFHAYEGGVGKHKLTVQVDKKMSVSFRFSSACKKRLKSFTAQVESGEKRSALNSRAAV
ncbi:MAG: hypothetical protein AAFO91_16040, partial [Bacteroidota bacterium]